VLLSDQITAHLRVEGVIKHYVVLTAVAELQLSTLKRFSNKSQDTALNGVTSGYGQGMFFFP
jgi:hypothetical protein